MNQAGRNAVWPGDDVPPGRHHATGPPARARALLGDDGKPAGRRLYDLVGLVDQGVLDHAGSPVPQTPYFRHFYFRHAVNSKKGVYYPLGAPSCVKPGPVR